MSAAFPAERFARAVSVWLYAMRPRTLPLSAAGMVCGGMIAWQQQHFQAAVFVLSLITAMLLQIFSNLANDYGDWQNGADNNRRNPPRVLASGWLNERQMWQGLLVCGLLCVFSGIGLLMIALPTHLSGSLILWAVWLMLGGSALWAAWHYTAGHRPYGYRGLGDLAVWLFFGLLAVSGSVYLQGASLNAQTWVLANGMGLWCAAVLNINNMRDINGDLAAGKHTIAARLGLHKAAFIYHPALLVGGAVCWLFWLWRSLSAVAALIGFAVLSICVFWLSRRLYCAVCSSDAADFNPLLAATSLFILGWVLLAWAWVLLLV
ncbi:1,4-dihydroxy-2-naphthoate octaprenyltransferase [Stenoxybacter acetivorans]|uniref:1,4-dihydroxy-2-naphthoate octaprenyltransferase n=1 Tax=Stenoxybacter acetivorans TaxID=422441 RepID=UPI00068BE719|nr:1,4-dihydroxy-2-naphthoate octaprenyltransferase [Stenoxybacter acetivorans]